MKKIIYTTIAILFSHALQAQIFWTEAFENSNTGGALAAGSNTGNGAWTVTDSGPALDLCGYTLVPNTWYVSCAENGQAAGVCGAGCGSDESLHVGSVTLGDMGASYDAGGWCSFGLGGFGDGTTTDKRAESPTINCAPYTTITLAFNYIENGNLALDNATLWWFNGTIWAQLFDLAKTPLCAGQGLWTAYSVVLPAGANNNPNVKIGFQWVNNDDGAGTDPSFAVDDITLSAVTAPNTLTTGSVTGSPFCACAAVNVPFTSTGTLTAGNIYTAQLSNSAGSFAAPVTIGTLASTANSGTISCAIPCNTASGSMYRVRVISSAPSITGSNNPLNIVINVLPTVNAGSDQTVCAGTSVTLSGTGAATYSWDNAVINGVSFVPTATETYHLQGIDVNGCQGADSVQVIVNTPSVSSLNQTALDSYTLNGQTYTQSGTYSQIIPNAAGCDSTITLNLTVNYTGINEIKTFEISIYPNPSRDIIFINSEIELFSSYELIDNQGRIVLSNALKGYQTSVNLEAIAPGNYYLKIEEKKILVTVVKQ